MKALMLQMLYAIDRAPYSQYSAVVDLVSLATLDELRELDSLLTALDPHPSTPVFVARAELLRWVRLYLHINREA